MQDRIPVNPGRVLIAPENGSPAYYATMTRADNPTQEGTPLNKANLLKDNTAAKFGLGVDAVPDDALSAIKTLIDGANANANAKAKIATGSYTGTGKYGSSNPNSLTFDFEPKMVVVAGSSSSSDQFYSGCWLKGVPRGDYHYCKVSTGSLSQAYLSLAWSGNTLSWYTYGSSPTEQGNNSGTTYYWVAIG